MEKDKPISLKEIKKLAKKINFEEFSDEKIERVINNKFNNLTKEEQTKIILTSIVLYQDEHNKLGLTEKEIQKSVSEFVIECGLEYYRRKGLLKKVGKGKKAKWTEVKKNGN